MNAKLTLTTLGVIVLGTSLSGQAGPLVDQRGYDTCVDGIKEELRNQVPVMNRFYFVNANGEKRSYFINATAWQGSSREPMRAECVTEANGRQIVALTVEPGRFTNIREGRVEIEVAAAN